ncbi:hypothetical protein AHAS_Ahas13G0070800 [Arachis hypogaea]
MQEGVQAVEEGLVPVQVVWVEVPSMGAGPVAPHDTQGDAMELAGTGVPAEIGVGEGIREEVCVFEEGLVPVPVNWAGTVDDGRDLGSLPGMLDRGRGKEVAMAGNRTAKEWEPGWAKGGGAPVKGISTGIGTRRNNKHTQEDMARDSQEAQMHENEITWALAVESGAVLYDDDVDIMSILKAQNDEIAAKRRLTKQKEKARRSRPKNKHKVNSTLSK